MSRHMWIEGASGAFYLAEVPFPLAGRVRGILTGLAGRLLRGSKKAEQFADRLRDYPPRHIVLMLPDGDTQIFGGLMPRPPETVD